MSGSTLPLVTMRIVTRIDKGDAHPVFAVHYSRTGIRLDEESLKALLEESAKEHLAKIKEALSHEA